MPARFLRGPDQPACLDMVLFAAWFPFKGPTASQNWTWATRPGSKQPSSAAYSASSLSCGKNSEYPGTDGATRPSHPAGRVQNPSQGKKKSTDRWGRSRRVWIQGHHRRTSHTSKRANASSVPKGPTMNLMSRIVPRCHCFQLRYNKLLATAPRVSIKHHISINRGLGWAVDKGVVGACRYPGHAMSSIMQWVVSYRSARILEGIQCHSSSRAGLLYIPGSSLKGRRSAVANIAENRFSTRRKLQSSSFGTSPDTSTEKMLTGGPKNVDNLACALAAGQVRTGARTRGGGKEGEHGDGPNSLVAHANSRA